MSFTNKPPLGTLLTSGHPQLDSLWGWWTFQEGAGGKICDLINRNHGTVVNMAFPSTVSSGWNPGKAGKTLAYDGNNDRVLIDNENRFDFEYTDPCSISCWIRLAPTVINGMFVAKSLAGPNFRGWSFWHDITGRVRRSMTNAPGVTIGMTVNETVDDNIWHNIVSTYDGGGVLAGSKIYIDGILGTTAGGETSDSLAGNTILNDVQVEFGSRNGGNLPYLGLIDDVRIYKKELTAAEVANIQTDQWGAFSSGVDVALLSQLGIPMGIYYRTLLQGGRV